MRRAEQSRAERRAVAWLERVRYGVRIESYSIPSARENLARLADLAERGEPVRIERKGHLPLVLVAERDLSPRGDHFFDMLEELRRSTGGADFVRPLSRPTSWAGREDARLAAKGIAVSCEDVQIASVAAVRGLTLVSADAVFSRFERLAVTDWAREGRARG